MRNVDPSNIDLVVRLVMSALPESFSERKRALVTLHTMLPKGHRSGSEIAKMISAMNQVERSQSILCLQGGTV